MGIDLQRNLNSEPTGVWCIRDEEGNLLFCSQVYQVVGVFSNGEKAEVKYEKVEHGCEVSAVFLPAGSNTIDVQLEIGKLKT